MKGPPIAHKRAPVRAGAGTEQLLGAHCDYVKHVSPANPPSPQAPVLGRTDLGAARVAPFIFGLRATLPQRKGGIPFARAPKSRT
jgi:hypothetical protein